MEDKNSSVKKSLAISIIVLLGKVLGFVKQSVIAWAFGSSSATDIYFAADGYTSMFGQIMGQSVAPTVLTRYVKLDEEGKKEQAMLLIKQSFFFFGLVGLFLVGLNIIFSSTICDVIGISYSDSQKQELRFFVMALCPVMLFASLAGVAQGFLDAHNCFLPAKLCSLFFSVSIIICVVVLRQSFGIRSLLFGFIFGYAAHTILMVSLSATKTGLFQGNPFRNAEFNQMLKRFWPLLIGNSIVDLGHLIDKIVASSLVAGSVSALFYAQVISSDLVNAVIITSIGTVLLTTLTSSVSKQTEKESIRGKIQFAICSLLLLTGLVTVLYLVEGTDLIKIVYERGNFESTSTVLVSSIASFYAFGFVFMAIREILVKAHYAFQDTMTPMINSIIGVVVNLTGSIILSRVMGVAGVALATSVSMMVVSSISLFTIKKHLGLHPIDRSSLFDILKIVLGMSISGIIGFLVFHFTEHWNSVIRLFSVSSLIVVAYLICLGVLRERVLIKLFFPIIKKRIHF